MKDITPLSATHDSITLSREDYEELLRMIPDSHSMGDSGVPGRWDDQSAFRIINGEVYEVLFDSRGNSYLKQRGVLVDHE